MGMRASYHAPSCWSICQCEAQVTWIVGRTNARGRILWYTGGISLVRSEVACVAKRAQWGARRRGRTVNTPRANLNLKHTQALPPAGRGNHDASGPALVSVWGWGPVRVRSPAEVACRPGAIMIPPT